MKQSDWSPDICNAMTIGGQTSACDTHVSIFFTDTQKLLINRFQTAECWHQTMNTLHQFVHIVHCLNPVCDCIQRINTI